MKKINSIHFGGQMLTIGIGLMVVLPVAGWLIKGDFFWQLCIPGALVLLAFAVIFAIEMRQDNGETPFYEKTLTETIPFDRENQTAVIKASICTGEKVAGFKDKKTGHFTEVMVLRSEEEKQRFMKLYDITDLPTQY